MGLAGSVTIANNLAETKTGDAGRLYDILVAALKTSLDAAVPPVDTENRKKALKGVGDLATNLANWAESPLHDLGTVSGGSVTFEFLNGRDQKVVLGANTTFAFSDIATSGTVVLHIVQDAMGNRVATWPSAAKFRNGSTDSTLSTGGNARDVYVAACDGTNLYFYAVAKNVV